MKLVWLVVFSFFSLFFLSTQKAHAQASHFLALFTDGVGIDLKYGQPYGHLLGTRFTLESINRIRFGLEYGSSLPSSPSSSLGASIDFLPFNTWGNSQYFAPFLGFGWEDYNIPSGYKNLIGRGTSATYHAGVELGFTTGRIFLGIIGPFRPSSELSIFAGVGLYIRPKKTSN